MKFLEEMDTYIYILQYINILVFGSESKESQALEVTSFKCGLHNKTWLEC